MTQQEYARRLMASVTFNPLHENIAFAYGRNTKELKDINGTSPVAIFKYQLKWVSEDNAVLDDKKPILVFPGSTIVPEYSKYFRVKTYNKYNLGEYSERCGGLRIVDKPFEVKSVSELLKLVRGSTGGNMGTPYEYIHTVTLTMAWREAGLNISLFDTDEALAEGEINNYKLTYDTEEEKKIIMDYLSLMRKKAIKDE